MIELRLPVPDMARADWWARWMTSRARTRHYRNHDYGEPTRRFEESEEAELLDRFRGLAAEIGISRLTGLPWHDPRHQSSSADPDVGDDIGVRWSRRPRLIVRKADPDAFRYFLVTGEPPLLEVHGWIRGRDAKRLDFWQSSWDPPAWTVPAALLVPYAGARLIPA